MSLDLIKNSLMYSVSSTDLFEAVTRKRKSLLRTGDLLPQDKDYVPDKGMEDKMELDGDPAYKWYPPAEIKYVEDQDGFCDVPTLNPIANSLQILKLPGMSLKGEMVPFLLKACPKLKSLGHGGSIPYGLDILDGMDVEYFDVS